MKNIDKLKMINDRIQMNRSISQHTTDAEINRYHQGYMDALEWVIADIFRDERINEDIIVTQNEIIQNKSKVKQK